MSVDANIDVHLDQLINLSVVDLIDVLRAAGWSFIRDGDTAYLPLGDKGMFNWQVSHDMNQAEFAKLVCQKQHANELIGLIMTWQLTDIGGIFLCWPSENRLSFDIDANRQLVKISANFVATNFQWYLEKILPPLDAAFGVESFSCSEHR